MTKHRPIMNYFGYIMKKITDPLIKKPMEEAVRAGVSDMGKIISRAGTSAEAGGVVGGIATGLGALGGGIGGAVIGTGLGELLRRNRIEQEQDMLARKLVEQLGPRLPELNMGEF